MDIHFNADAAFTKWVVGSGLLREAFVVVDVGVQGGENVRWQLLGDHLVVHGFDAIKEVIDTLQRQNAGKPNRHYHWIAAGDTDGERTFYFNPSNPCSSSFYQQGDDRSNPAGPPSEQARTVPVRRLDTLRAEGVIPPKIDFLKTDVEGFEKDVFLGARQLLSAGVLGLETETNFGISPTYPDSHFGTLADLALDNHLLVFDLGFDRAPRASYQRALARKGLPPVTPAQQVGKPSTLNVLFCRDLIQEDEHPECYRAPCPPVGLDGIVKAMIIYELHGLNDIAVDTAERFRNQLSGRLDVDEAIDLLANPDCRLGPLGPVRERVRRLTRAVQGITRRTARTDQAGAPGLSAGASKPSR